MNPNRRRCLNFYFFILLFYNFESAHLLGSHILNISVTKSQKELLSFELFHIV